MCLLNLQLALLDFLPCAQAWHGDGSTLREAEPCGSHHWQSKTVLVLAVHPSLQHFIVLAAGRLV